MKTGACFDKFLFNIYQLTINCILSYHNGIPPIIVLGHDPVSYKGVVLRGRTGSLREIWFFLCFFCNKVKYTKTKSMRQEKSAP